MTTSNSYLRYNAGEPASIVFTSDFHELLKGELLPGNFCGISYDPLRIAPPECGFIHGSTEHPVVAHVLFAPGGIPLQIVLTSEAGILRNPVESISGQGSMLCGAFQVPADAAGISIWFTYVDAAGHIHYDSDYGKNYNFRFATLDITLRQAVVTSDPQTPYSGFGVEVAAIPSVTAVGVRFNVVNNPDFKKVDIPLTDTGNTDDTGKRIWSVFGVAVPYQSIVRFKLFYVIEGVRYKDDDSGRYFIAPQPETSPLLGIARVKPGKSGGKSQ